MIARAADFQASWFFSLLALVIIAIVLGAAGWTLVGLRRMWRQGDRAPAAVLGAATLFAVLALVGMYAVALGGVIANTPQAGAGG
ncbi:MAG: hypothetical protein ACYDAC_12435 [Candidatus Dormibacteria bacterium]